jgi:hypothetical protein
LVTNPEAEAQGKNRLERGQSVFQEAAAMARLRGWQFNWKLAIVPGVGHNDRAIFGSPQVFEALRP